MRVLLLDDSRLMRMVIRRALRLAGIADDVTEARDGVEGLELLGRQRFDLVICDLSMPRMDGMEFLERMGAGGYMKDTRVLVLSAEGAPEVMSEARRRGAQGYLRKPVTPESLQHAIGMVME